MSGTTYGGEAGGVTEGGGGDVGCATCREMAKYGTEGSKAG